ncbi:MAG: ATP-binding protein [Planctomycetota bacterium]|nr:ATP-binding protein [Planctomycetota bacterium]
MLLPRQQRRWWPVAAALAVIACGSTLAWWQATQRDALLRAQIEREAWLFALGLDAPGIVALRRELTEGPGQHYERAQRHLAAIRAWDQRYRFVYLLVRDAEGRIVFAADSEPPESPDASPPGQVYLEAPAACRAVFEDGRARVVGPYRDRWGEWVSAFVPIYDPSTAVPGISTPILAQELVQRALAFRDANGDEALLRAVSDRNGPFCVDDLYLAVLRADGRLLAHPFVAVPPLDAQSDWPSHPITRAILDAVADREQGWAEYRYRNPVTGVDERKRTFVRRAGDLLLCAGAYASSGEIVAVFALDLAAEHWLRTLWLAALPTLLVSAALLGVIGGVAWLTRRGARRIVGLPTGLLVGTGALIVSGLLAWIMHAAERQLRAQQAHAIAEERVLHVLSTLRHTTGYALYSLRALVSGSFDAQQFERQILAVADQVPISAWAWIEATELSPQGWQVRALQARPEGGGTIALDLQHPAQQEAIVDALRSGMLSSALLPRSAERFSGELWFWLATPKGSGPLQLVGIAVRLNPLLRHAYFDTVTTSSVWLSWPGGGSTHLAGLPLREAERSTALSLPVALGNHTVVLQAGVELPARAASWAVILALGLLASVALGYLAWRGVREHDRLERLVDERTMTLALREAEQRQAAARYRAASEILAKIVSDQAWSAGDIPTLSRWLCEQVAQRFGIARVGIWLFDDAGQHLVCQDTYDLASGCHSSGEILVAEQYRAEFEYLQRERCVVAHDAWSDPRTAGYVEGYLKPLGITSMLDAGIRSEQGCLGTVCFEHIGPARRWSDEEVAFACELADQIAIAIANRRRRLAEQAIIRQEQQLREILAQLDAGVLIIVDERPAYANPYAQRWLPQALAPLLARARAGDGTDQCAWESGDGRTVHALVAIRTLQSAEGPQRLITFVDISTQKAMERQLTELAERAQELAQRAEAANAAKSAFLASISHEIRTPLHGILGMCEILESGELSDEQRDLVRTLRHSAEALLALLNNILDYSKIETGKLQLECVPCAAETLANEVCDLFRAQLSGDVDLWVRCQPRLPAQVMVDPLRLRQILVNLVGNALKFTRHGHIFVDLDWHDGWLECAVRDTGRGIAPEVLPRLFQPFQQADPSVSRTHGGSGLGLAICRRLCEAMGGEIAVDSTLGSGSVFRVRLPAACASAAAAPTPALAGWRILVVDERPTTGTLLVELLAQAGADAALRTPAQLADGASPDAAWQAVVVNLHGGADQATAVLSAARAALPAQRLIALCAARARPPRAALGDALLVSKPVAARELIAALLRAVQPSPPSEASTTAAPPALFSGRRILVVDDQPVNLHIARHQLARLGCTVITASDAATALEILEREAQAVELVLMDCQMPGLDGYAATRAWRAREAALGRERLPIIALTAHAIAEEHQRCLEAGMDGVLTKPISAEHLARALERWLPAAQEPRVTAPVDGGAPPALDDRNLRLLSAEDPELARHLIARLRRELTELRATCSGQLASDDWPALLAALAHRCIGAVGNLGGLALAERCRDLERAAAARDCARLHAAIAAWDEAYRAFLDALDSYEQRHLRDG